MQILYQATTNYFCAGLLVKNFIITEAAPIIKWAEGKNLDSFSNWLYKKGGKIRKVSEEC